MSIHPIFVKTARIGWKCQWNQLMNGLAPADKEGNYVRPNTEKKEVIIPSGTELNERQTKQLPTLIIGLSCPWAHRTWLVYQLRNLKKNLNLLIAKVDKHGGQWKIEPEWMGCNYLLDLYKLCSHNPNHRATVPVIIDPCNGKNKQALILGNESTELIKALNKWPADPDAIDLAPNHLLEEIDYWENIQQNKINNGVYKCGFARNQYAYDYAVKELFDALNCIDISLSKKGPWLCGDNITLADIRLFPTLIRWELVYMPLFGCSKEPLWNYKYLWEWRKRFLTIPSVTDTCNPTAWREDYFGALFPLNPSNIVPAGPNLIEMVNAKPPEKP